MRRRHLTLAEIGQNGLSPQSKEGETETAYWRVWRYTAWPRSTWALDVYWNDGTYITENRPTRRIALRRAGELAAAVSNPVEAAS